MKWPWLSEHDISLAFNHAIAMDFAVAVDLDEQDPLRELRHQFHIPTAGEVASKDVRGTLDLVPRWVNNLESLTKEEAEKEAVYLCGNSLGLLPKITKQLVNEELDVWSRRSELLIHSNRLVIH